MTKQHLLGLSIYYGNIKVFFSAIITHNYTSGILLANTLSKATGVGFGGKWKGCISHEVITRGRKSTRKFYFLKLKCCWDTCRFTESCKDNTEHSP